MIPIFPLKINKTEMEKLVQEFIDAGNTHDDQRENKPDNTEVKSWT